MKFNDVIHMINVENVIKIPSIGRVEFVNEDIKMCISSSNTNKSVDSLSVEINRMDKYAGFFIKEFGFKWFINKKEDIDHLSNKLSNIVNSNNKEHYEFSNRTTYVKKNKNGEQFAHSANFLISAVCYGMVAISEYGKLITDVTQLDPWYYIGAKTISGETSCILFDFDERWIPTRTDHSIKNNNTQKLAILESKIYNERATSVLWWTNGNLLTMQDKFLLDLAVKCFESGNVENSNVIE